MLMLRAVSIGDTACWPCQFDNLLHDLQANVKNVDIIASLLQVLEDAQAAATTNQQPMAPPADSPTADEKPAPIVPAATTASVVPRTAAAQDENAAPSPPQQTSVRSGDAAVSPATTASSPPASVAPPEHASPAAADSPAVQAAPAMPPSPEPASPVQQLAATAPLAPAAQQHADVDLMAEARAMAQQVGAVIYTNRSPSAHACSNAAIEQHYRTASSVKVDFNCVKEWLMSNISQCWCSSLHLMTSQVRTAGERPPVTPARTPGRRSLAASALGNRLRALGSGGATLNAAGEAPA